MFACLKVIPRASRGVWQGLLGSFLRPRTELYSARAFGVEFLLLEAETGKRGEPDWEAALELIHPFTRCLLTPEGYSIPAGLGLEAPLFADFEQRVLLKAACDLIDDRRIPLYRRILGLYDPEGAFAGELTRLLRHYTSVRVVTQALSRYQAAAHSALEELGAPVLLGQDPSDFSDCALLLCPAAPPAPLPLSPACAVLAGGCFPGGAPMAFSAPRVLMSPAEAAGIPQGISSHLFAGALYHHNRIEVAGLRAGLLSAGGRTVTLHEARELLIHTIAHAREGR